MLVQVPEPVPGRGQVGVEAHGLLEGREGLAVLPLRAVGTAEAVPGAGHRAVETQGLAEGGNRLGRARVVLEEDREVVPRERVLGPEPHHLASRVEGLAPGPGDAVERDELAPHVGQVGPPSDQLAVGGDRFPGASFEPASVAQTVEADLGLGQAERHLGFRRSWDRWFDRAARWVVLQCFPAEGASLIRQGSRRKDDVRSQ